MDIARASIQRRTVVIFLCVLIAFGGVFAYLNMGKLEDPNFTIKTAIVTTAYPGATANEVDQEVTSKIEDAIQLMGQIKHLRSLSTDGVSIVYVDIQDHYTSAELPQIWDELRQKINDALDTLPEGALTPNINNDYGDVYGQYYALVGDGYSMRQLWDYADFLKKELVLIPGVKSVRVSGDQEEQIFVEFSLAKLASLGLSPESIYNVLAQQNSIVSSGNARLGPQYLKIVPSSDIDSVESISQLVIGGQGGRLVRLADVATVRRGYEDPPSFMMRFNDRPSLGLGISCVPGGNVVTMGNAVKARLQELESQTPIGMELQEIYMQSDSVVTAVNDFLLNLVESVVIVVGVLLIFMGVRSGLIIGVILLLTIAATFIIMQGYGIFLQSISLAALIIALGSLVDNAIVVTEGILVGIQQGGRPREVASHVVSSNLWALLGGTIIAVLAFVPVGLSASNTGDFCRSLFQVIGISMMLSWVLAITLAPVFGVLVLRRSKSGGDPYDKLPFRMYRSFLELCLRNRVLTLGVVAAMFVLSLVGFTQLRVTFFPDSGAPYYFVDLWMPQRTYIMEQDSQTRKLEAFLRDQPEVKNISAFVGGPALRFMLPYTPEDNNTAYSQLLVEVHEGVSTQEMIARTEQYIDGYMPEVQRSCRLFPKGPDVKAKIEARFHGPDPKVLRQLAEQALEIYRQDPSSDFLRLDWRQTVAELRPQILEDQMRTLGLTRQDVARAISSATDGFQVATYREGDRLLPVMAGVAPDERYRVDQLLSFPIWSPTSNAPVPLGAMVSMVDTGFTDDIVRKRDRSLTMIAQSNVKQGENVNAMLMRVRPKIESIPLPAGYWLDWGGEYETNGEAQSDLKMLMPICVVIMFVICVFLFNAYKQTIIIFLCIPMIIIGVTMSMLILDLPISFMAVLGVLSLVGMLVKNSVVLLDQIAGDFASGKDRYQTIVDSGVSRLRPVSMSALTTVLGMVPLLWDVMFAPMAAAIIGGLTMGTILTLVVIPVLTAVFYRVPSPKKA